MQECWGSLAGTGQLKPAVQRRAHQSNKGIVNKGWEIYPEGHVLCNDPSAGSPTERFFIIGLLVPFRSETEK
jgi:hypothetical protein